MQLSLFADYGIAFRRPTEPFLTRLFTPHLQKADLEPNHKTHLMSRKQAKGIFYQIDAENQITNDAHIQSVFLQSVFPE